MCAVFGILGEYDPLAARRALGTLVHRGPDYCGIIEDENLFFAHQRLRIMETQPHTHQPVQHNGVMVSFNGEIYNFKALRALLNDRHDCQSEAEVLLAAYLHWGVDFIKHLVGMFVIAVYDHGILHLFRDRFGKKPLFYLHDAKRFIFASEIKALKPFLKQVRLNDDALMSYLGLLAPTPPHTFYEGIFKLESGCHLLFHKNTLTCKRYYDLLETPSASYGDEGALLKRLELQLHEALELRLQADVPMASLLSGGIDSAMIAAVAKAQGVNLQTFTLGYKGFANYDERANAAQSAALIGVDNREVVMSQDDFIDATDRVFDTLDEPLNDPAAIPLYLLFEAIAKEGYKVVLSGEGSDEIFLGYRQYFEYLDIEKAAALTHKNWLKKYFHSHFSMNREWEWYKRIFDDTLLFRTSGEKFTDLQKNMLLRRNVKDNDGLRFLAPYRRRFEASGHSDPALWYSYIDLQLFVAEHFLTKLDRVSMAHSIESRTPFLDHRLVETLFGADPALRYRDGISKSLLKKIGASYLDPSILSRKKKGFSNPYMEWLIASGRIESILHVNTKTGLFKDEVLQEYINRASKGRFKQHVWGLYVLSHWIDKELL